MTPERLTEIRAIVATQSHWPYMHALALELIEGVDSAHRRIGSLLLAATVRAPVAATYSNYINISVQVYCGACGWLVLPGVPHTCRKDTD